MSAESETDYRKQNDEAGAVGAEGAHSSLFFRLATRIFLVSATEFMYGSPSYGELTITPARSYWNALQIKETNRS